MAPVAIFGIENDGFGVVANLLVIFLIAVWFALVYWAFTDARRRLDDGVLIGAAAFAAFVFPFAGALVYAIVRPPETIDDRYERELDIRAAELRVRMLEQAVKSGPGGSGFSSAVAGEVAGEPAPPRRASGSRPAESRPAESQGPPARRQAGGAQTAPGARRAERPSEPPTRPSQAPRPPAEDPRQRPTA